MRNEVGGEQIIKIKLKTNKHSNERLGEVRGKQRERERINTQRFTDVYWNIYIYVCVCACACIIKE